MFDERDSRMPRKPDQDMADFVIDFLKKGADPTGMLDHLDRIVSVDRYTNREFTRLMDEVFDMADALLETRALRTVGEAVESGVKLFAADAMMEDNPPEVDRLSSRDYDALRGLSDNYVKIRRALEEPRDRDRGRGRRDERDDRGRGRDRGRDRRHPDDIREERQREARRERGGRNDRGRDRDDREERGRGRDDRDDRGRDTDSRRNDRSESRRDTRETRRGEPEKLSPAKAKQLLAEMEMAIWQHITKEGGDPNRLLSAKELDSINIDPELYVKLGGKIAAETTAAEVRAEPQQPFQESARHTSPSTQASETELNRSSRRAEAQRQRGGVQESIVEPPAFTEVFNHEDQEPVIAKTRASDPVPADAELVEPSIDPDIDYNANITTRGVTYATGEARPEWDPLVPTLQQWADAGFDVSDKLFIASLPPLPVVRGFANHLPAVFDPERWVPVTKATPDGYRLESFRERDMNKDDILIPNFGAAKRKEHVQNGFLDAAKKTTRYDPLTVAAEEHAAVKRYDEEHGEWVAHGSDTDNEPQQEVVDTKRHGQLMRLQPTIHATTVEDAVIRMHSLAGSIGVGLEESANIMANAELHTLLGVCTSEEEYLATKQALSLFTRDGAGGHLTIVQLWRTLVESRTTVPFAIWNRLDRMLTNVISGVLHEQMTLPLALESFAAQGDTLIDIIAEKSGRYMAETLSRHVDFISRALRGVSFNPDENLGDVKWGIWFVTPRRLVYANATLGELNLAVTDAQALTMTTDQPVSFVIRPEQNVSFLGALDRLMSDVRNTVGGSAEALSEVVLDIITIDDYRVTVTQNWLSKDLYLSMTVRRV